MEPYLFWILAGSLLVIFELMTGTFYLLVIGIAAFGAAAVAFLGLSFPIQSITAAVLGIAGSWLVHVYRAKNTQQQMRSIDYGQPVVFESWIDQENHRAKVMYRGAPWEAEVDGNNDSINQGMTLYILANAGNTLTITKNRPK